MPLGTPRSPRRRHHPLARRRSGAIRFVALAITLPLLALAGERLAATGPAAAPVTQQPHASPVVHSHPDNPEPTSSTDAHSAQAHSAHQVGAPLETPQHPGFTAMLEHRGHPTGDPTAAVTTEDTLPAAAAASPVPTVSPAGQPAAMAVMGNPIDCSGYAEPRVFLEVQDWWLQTPGAAGTSFGHVHVGTCFPYGATLSGVVGFDVRVVMHENPGVLQRVDIGLFTGEDEDGGVLVGVPFQTTCVGTCTFWGHAEVDTAAAGYDGWQEFRFKARVDEPDGARMVTSSGWPVNLANGNPSREWRDGAGVTGRGWYTDVGYQNASLAALPVGPVSGTWTPTVRMGPGSGGSAATYHVAAVDPDVHAGMPGWVVLEGAGEYRGPLSVDTTQLANGRHRLVLRSDSALPNGSTHSGLLVVTFDVSN